MSKRHSIAKDLKRGLRWFIRKLKSGESITFTRVVRHETPDGTMHEFRKMRTRPAPPAPPASESG